MATLPLPARDHSRSPARATLLETLATVAAAVGPLFAKGLIVRRPLVVALLEMTGAEAAAISLLRKLRSRHGDGPLLLRSPMHEEAVLLSPDHVRTVLAGTPEPFESDSVEKHAALAHFQPDGVLISRGDARAARRQVSEAALETHSPVHSFTPRLSSLVAQEVASLMETAAGSGALSYRAFKAAWFRMVRAAVFGTAARADDAFTRRLDRLRGNANWAFLKQPDTAARDSFRSELRRRLADAEPDSLGAIAMRRAGAGDAPEDQVAQWLFAFDGAAIATFRTLALLDVHPEHEARAAASAAGGDPELAFLRACLLDVIRLWPTTPAVLRETDSPVILGDTRLPGGTTVLIHLPFFHRDESRIPYAHRFVPDVWLDGRAERWPFVPFSAGPAECPGRNLVLLLGSRWLAAMLRDHRFALPHRARLLPSKLPATFDQFHLKLRVTGRETGR